MFWEECGRSWSWHVLSYFSICFKGLRTTSSHLFWMPSLWIEIELRPSKCKPGEFNHTGAMFHTVVERNTAVISLSQDHEFSSAVILDMDLAVIICYIEFVHFKHF
jgi:hypothetical protein